MFEKDYAQKVKKAKGSAKGHYLRTEVFRDLTYSHQLSSFIMELTKGTSSQANWEAALQTAEHIDDLGVWETVTNQLKRFADKSKKPDWLPLLVHRFIKGVKVNNYERKSVISVCIRAGIPAAALKYFDREKPEDMIRAIADITPQIDNITYQRFLGYFNDWELMNSMLYTKKVSPPLMRFMLIKTLRRVETDALDNFTFFEFDNLMKNYPEEFNQAEVINSACAAHRVKRAHSTTDLLVDLINKGSFTPDARLGWFWGMYEQQFADQNIKLNSALYELTQDDKYLPDDAKEMFLF